MAQNNIRIMMEKLHFTPNEFSRAFTGQFFVSLFTEREEAEIQKTIESYYGDIWLCLDQI